MLQQDPKMPSFAHLGLSLVFSLFSAIMWYLLMSCGCYAGQQNTVAHVQDQWCTGSASPLRLHPHHHMS